MRTMIVGQAHSKGQNGKAPFWGKTGDRLAFCAGVSKEDLQTLFDCRNLLNYFPGKNENVEGDRFPRTESSKAADNLELAPRSLILGRRAAYAFGIASGDYLKWREFADFKLDFYHFKTSESWRDYTASRTVLVTVFPHPSGLNRWWNELKNVDDACVFMKKLVTVEAREQRSWMRGFALRRDVRCVG